jgi:hypothetical protein
LPELFVAFPPDLASLLSGALEVLCLAEDELFVLDWAAETVLLSEFGLELLAC